MVNWAPGMRLQMADTAGGLKMSTAEIIGLIEISRSAAPGLIVKKLRKSNYSYEKSCHPKTPGLGLFSLQETFIWCEI